MLWDEVVEFYQKELRMGKDDMGMFGLPCFNVENIHEWIASQPKDRIKPDGTACNPPFPAWFMEVNMKGEALGLVVGVMPLVEGVEEVFAGKVEGKDEVIDDIMKKFVEVMTKGELKVKDVLDSGNYIYRVDCYLKRGKQLGLYNPTVFFDKQFKRYFISKSKPGFEQVAGMFQTLIFNFLILLSAKNISIQIYRKPSDEINKKREKNGKLPLFTYKMLTIDPEKVNKEFLPKMTDGNFKSLRYHLCRGHLKTFTEEAPLFGKYTGTWFWSPLMRGKKGLGEIKKDYNVVAPEEKQSVEK